MTIIQAIIYGIVQGIGEFLPISSTAHLVLLPWFFGWKEMPASFDVALHLGTAVAVILFFLKDWINLVVSGFTKPKTPDGKLFWLLVIGTVPAGVIGLLLHKYMEALRSPLLIGIMLIIMGFILYFTDKFGRSNIDIKKIGLSEALTVGMAQVLAAIPGVSRSGITMSAGRAIGIKRESIARFTFLLSTPIVLADGLYNLKELKGSAIPMVPFSVAIVTSAVVGALSIGFLLNYLKNKGFGIFAVYRLILGAIVIGVYFLR